MVSDAEREEIAELEDEVTSLIGEGGNVPDGYAQLVTAKALLSIASSLASLNHYGIETYKTT
ncbi:hypothetical protein J2Y41_004675 [Arthrobacter sp. 1088]|uniref:hypothetical protein n=1 Tax=Arthrobacter sp. 1088 TaxID=2817768 RepID=UPI002866778F|nr:hypothetical protein [Arthrobacter sp. 1088]MDR6689071.1 hypothetical protein [Arthrobacter sp. 1088]